MPASPRRSDAPLRFERSLVCGRYGKFAYASGDVYEGDYEVGNMVGVGTYHYASGNAKVGRYVAGKRYGDQTRELAHARPPAARTRAAIGPCV